MRYELELRKSKAYGLLKWDAQTTDVLEDIIFEAEDVLNVGFEKAKYITEKVLDNYFYKSKLPQDIDKTHCHIVFYILQPYRVSTMIIRMDDIINRLKNYPDLKTVLDYGGGGGRDSILYSKLGYEVTYSDLLDTLTPFVSKRFELRGLNIEIIDARKLKEKRYHIINCIDVLEHIYDLEVSLADIISYLTKDGHLICHPNFTIDCYRGSHIFKNCGYKSYFLKMLLKIGFRDAVEKTGYHWQEILKNFLKYKLKILPCESKTYHLIRTRPTLSSIRYGKEQILKELYILSKQYSFNTILISLVFFPMAAIIFLLTVLKFRNLRKEIKNNMFDNIISNLAIWRLSCRRLNEIQKKKMPVILM